MRARALRGRVRRVATIGLSATAMSLSLVGLIGSPAVADDSDPTPSPSAPGAAPSAAPTAQPTPTASPTSTQASVPVPKLRSRALTGPTTGTRTVVLRGTGLGDVGSVSLGSMLIGSPRHLSATRIALRIGTAPDFAPAKLRIVLHRASNGAAVRTPVTFTYVAEGFRARELRWAWAHLEQRTYTWGHSYIYKYDCANFASHALVAAGMTPAVLDVSSTALRRKLLALGATELPDTQRSRRSVRVGDVIQFDWQPTRANPNDRDHTGIVTAVDRDANGRVVVRYSAHTDGGNNPSKQLQVELTMHRPHHDPHGKVYFLRLPR